MISLGHGCVGSNDLEKAKAFYDALLGSAGITTLFPHPSGGRGPKFYVSYFRDLDGNKLCAFCLG